MIILVIPILYQVLQLKQQFDVPPLQWLSPNCGEADHYAKQYSFVSKKQTNKQTRKVEIYT